MQKADKAPSYSKVLLSPHDTRLDEGKLPNICRALSDATLSLNGPFRDFSVTSFSGQR